MDSLRGSGGDLAPSMGGRKKIFTDQDFWITIFSEKFYIFMPKNSDDLFLVINHVFQMTLSSQEKALFQKIIPWRHLFFTLFVYTFARIRQHYFSKYWGTDAWAVLPPQIWGDHPPSPSPRSPPLLRGVCHCISVFQASTFQMMKLLKKGHQEFWVETNILVHTVAKWFLVLSNPRPSLRPCRLKRFHNHQHNSRSHTQNLTDVSYLISFYKLMWIVWFNFIKLMWITELFDSTSSNWCELFDSTWCAWLV